MDSDRFDAFVRSLGARATRRGALGGLIGAGLAGAAATAAAGKNRAGKKRKQNRAAGRVSAEAADCLSPGPSSNMNECTFIQWSNGQDFAGQDLSSSSMRGATFRGANLCRADLSSSQLKNANFRGLGADNKTDLTRADFRSSGCNGTLFTPNTVLCGTRMCNGAIRNDHCPPGVDPAFACCADGGCEPGRTCINGECRDVCASGCLYDSLADAVAAASDVATIRVCAGTFRTLNVGIGADLTIVGAGSGAGGTTLDAEGDSRVLEIGSGSDVVLRDLRVTGGERFNGGGILNFGTRTLGNGSRVEDNDASDRGGGIFQISGSSSILEAGSVVTGNTAGTAGGGVFANFQPNGGTVNIADTTIVTGNTPDNCAGTAEIPNCVNP